MKRWIYRILSGLLEGFATHLIGGAMFAAWLLALGLAGKCIALFAPQSIFLLSLGVGALALTVPFLLL